MYENAERYLCDVLQERFDIQKLLPISKWNEDIKIKIAEWQSLCYEYTALIKEVNEACGIQRSIMNIYD